MKNLISFITLLVFLHSTTYHMISTEAKNGLPDPVLDLDGNVVLAGITNTYFILSAFKGMGGLSAKPEGILKFPVFQLKNESDPGYKLAFRPDGFEEGDVVLESTNMKIEFRIIDIIDAYWKVEYENSTEQNFVNIGLPVQSNWFKFEKVGIDKINVYKIVFCTSVCSDVGIYEENELSRLALSDDHIHVAFQKTPEVDHKKY